MTEPTTDVQVSRDDETLRKLVDGDPYAELDPFQGWEFAAVVDVDEPAHTSVLVTSGVTGEQFALPLPPQVLDGISPTAARILAESMLPHLTRYSRWVDDQLLQIGLAEEELSPPTSDTTSDTTNDDDPPGDGGRPVPSTPKPLGGAPSGEAQVQEKITLKDLYEVLFASSR